MFFQREPPTVREAIHLLDRRMERYQRPVILWSFPDGRRWIARRNHANNGGSYQYSSTDRSNSCYYVPGRLGPETAAQV